MKKIIFLIFFLVLLISCSSTGDTNNSNNSSSWTNLPFSGDDGYGIYSSCTNGGDLFIGTHTAGIFKSSDGGNTWLAVNNGIVDTKLCEVFSNNNILYATTAVICPNCSSISKIYKSTDSGNTWVPIWSVLHNNGNSWSQETNDNISFVNTDIYVSKGLSLYKSSDNGANWQLVFTNPNTSFPSSIDKVLKINTSVFLIADGIVYKSTDNGNSFLKVDNIINGDIQMRSIAASDSNLFLGTELTNPNTAGVYVTNEAATNWQLFNQDFNFGEFDLVNFGCLFNDNNVVYVSCNNNLVFKSTNNGINWQKLGDKVDVNETSIPDRNILKINNSLFLVTVNKLYKYNL